MKSFLTILRLCRIGELGVIMPVAVASVFLLCGKNFDIFLFFYVVMALTCGFMAGCVFNGLCDKAFDAQNPRTYHRPVASGRISAPQALAVIAILGALVVLFTAMISPLLILWLPLPIALCFFYCLSKRYTWLCHTLIGVVHAICPVAIAIVFCRVFDLKTLLITGITAVSTTETDLLYSIQDVEYDIAANLKSVPAVFGAKAARILSLICFFLSLCLQIVLYTLIPFGVVSAMLVGMANLLLLRNHVLMFCKTIDSRQVLRTYQRFLCILMIATIIPVI